jgi:hypothetical protein
MIVWIAHAKVGNRRDLIPKTPNLFRLGVLLCDSALPHCQYVFLTLHFPRPSSHLTSCQLIFYTSSSLAPSYSLQFLPLPNLANGGNLR